MKDIKPRRELQLHPCASVDWKIKNIPLELQEKPQWKLCHLVNTFINGIYIQTPKRPIGGPTTTDTKPLQQLAFLPLEPDQDIQHFGFCFTNEDEIVGIDVDQLPPNFTFEDLPTTIQGLLKLHPTYAEVSPSGQGLHIFYRMNKALLIHRAAADKGVIGFNGAVYIRNQFMTFTGHVFPPSKPQQQLAIFDTKIFEQFILKPTNIQPIPLPATQHVPASRQPPPTITLLENWLSEIPPSLSTSPLKERFYNIYRTFTPPMECPSDYDHWRTIAAAVHHGAVLAGQVQEGAILFDDWSSRDTLNYESSEAAQKKYYDNPPTFDGTDITHATLAALAQAALPLYPEIAKTGPIPNNVQNFLAHINHFGLSLAMNDITKDIQATGNEALVKKHFKGPLSRVDLETCVMSLCHDNTIFRAIGSSTAASFAKAMTRDITTYNPIKRWIDEAPTYQSGHSYFNELFDTLKIPNHELDNATLYKTYLKKALMGVIRAHYYKGSWSGTTGIVILQGPEQTYKSTWVKQLLPLELRPYIFCSQARLSKSDNVKEIQLEAGTCQIWVRDEVEALLIGGDAALKNLLVQENDAYRPLYSTTPVNVPRKCIFFGTTNVRELPITDDGSRRIQIIPVEKCDTAAQLDIDIVMVYKELLYEFQNTKKNVHELWTLTKEEIELTNAANFSKKADQDSDTYLKECYSFDEPFDVKTIATKYGNIRQTDAKSYKEVMITIRDICGVTLSPAALKHALHRQCGQWTGSYIKPIHIGNSVIDRGWAYQKKASGKGDIFSGWILPLKVTEFPRS